MEKKPIWTLSLQHFSAFILGMQGCIEEGFWPLGVDGSYISGMYVLYSLALHGDDILRNSTC